AAHRVEDRLNYSESQRKSNEDVCQNYRVRREHDLLIFWEVPADHSIFSPQQEQSKSRDRRRNRGRQRDRHDDGVASPEVITRKHVSSEQTEENIKGRRPKTGNH